MPMVGVVGADVAAAGGAATGVAVGVAGVAGVSCWGGTGVEGKAGVVVWFVCWLATVIVALGMQ